MRKFPLRAVVAGALTIALIGAGATAANAAPVAQSNGSPGAIYLFDENLESVEANLSFQKDTIVTTSASPTDGLARVMQADYLDATELADPNKQTFMFVSTTANMTGGVNTWNAYAESASSQGGVLTGTFTMAEMISGGDINKVFNDGGTYNAGIAWTNVAGAVVYATVYRTIHVTAGTNAYTVDPVDAPVNPGLTVTPQPENASVNAGSTATFTAGATPGSPAVQWESSTDGTTWAPISGATSGTLTVPSVTAAQNGTQYRAVFTDGTQSVTSNAATLTVNGAPVVTVNPVSDPNVIVGDVKTLTADATGNPTPTVKWWEKSTNGTDFTELATETSKTLTVPTATAGTTHYRAVFTNSAGSATTTAAQVVVSPLLVEPTSPASDATKKPITVGDGTVTLTGVPAGTYTAYAWSTPTNLGTVVVPASGIATIPVPAGLQNGAAHTFALLQANNEIVAWGNVVVPAPPGPDPSLTSTTQLTADVTVSGKFALEGVNTGPIALGTAKRGATTAAVALGAFTVTDDRDVLKGWTLNAAVAAFKNAANDEIPGTALGLTPKKVGGPVDGITNTNGKAAGDPWTSTLIAEGAVGSYTPETGTQFDADLTFKAPANAKKGTYTSTLTLTLASK